MLGLLFAVSDSFEALLKVYNTKKEKKKEKKIDMNKIRTHYLSKSILLTHRCTTRKIFFESLEDDCNL